MNRGGSRASSAKRQLVGVGAETPLAAPTNRAYVGDGSRSMMRDPDVVAVRRCRPVSTAAKFVIAAKHAKLQSGCSSEGRGTPVVTQADGEPVPLSIPDHEGLVGNPGWIQQPAFQPVAQGRRRRHDVVKQPERAQIEIASQCEAKTVIPQSNRRLVQKRDLASDTQSLFRGRRSPLGRQSHAPKKRRDWYPSALEARDSQAGKAPPAPSGLKPSPVQNWLKRCRCLIFEPPAAAIATMAATNKCLAQSNKSLRRGQATNNEEAPGSGRNFVRWPSRPTAQDYQLFHDGVIVRIKFEATDACGKVHKRSSTSHVYSHCIVIHFAAHPPSNLWPKGIAACSHAEWAASRALAERNAIAGANNRMSTPSRSSTQFKCDAVPELEARAG